MEDPTRSRGKKRKKKRKRSKMSLVSYEELVFTILLMCLCYHLGFYSNNDVLLDCYNKREMKHYRNKKNGKGTNNGFDEIDLIEALVKERVAAGKLFH